MLCCNKTTNIVEFGDVVIAYEGFGYCKPLIVEKDKIFNCSKGHYQHNLFVGQPFGKKIFSQKGNDFIYLLKPTAELWTSSLKHRTEIIYTVDISQIIINLEIRPGCVVLESGTGSGSLSTSIARAVAPNGHLHTYEFHQGRADAANVDFKMTGLDKIITVYCQDVCSQGFCNVDDEKADAIFLDLPTPWVAFEHAKKKLKISGKICTFSPCIEQIQKTCAALRENNFSEIITLECRLRTYEVSVADSGKGYSKQKRKAEEMENDNREILTKPLANAKGHSGFLTFARKTPNNNKTETI